MFNRTSGLAPPLATLAALLASPAFAAPISIVADPSWDGRPTASGPGYTIRAFSNNNPLTAGFIGIKQIPTVGAGAGVEGQGNDEIDVFGRSSSEVLRFDFTQPGVISNLVLGLLFDGPEYGDWEEVARFDVTFAGQPGAQTYTLRTNYLGPNSSDSTWDGSATAWTSSGVTEGNAGLWSNADPFGNRSVSRIDMYAANSYSCYRDNACSDQSDYVFRSMNVTAVPEPATLSLLGLGLLGIGFARRTRARC